MELSELFAQSVREVLPLARRKGLVSYFDYHGPNVELHTNVDSLRRGVHRILLGLLDCFESGFVMFCAAVKVPHAGRTELTIHAAGTGAMDAAGIGSVSDRLQLQARSGSSRLPRSSGARSDGNCPATGGRVVLVNADTDGLIISLDLSVAASEPVDRKRLPDAAGAIAWLISPRPGDLGCIDRRLVRLGWRVRSFTSLALAPSLILAAPDVAAKAPHLLIVAEVTGAEVPTMEKIAAWRPALWAVLAIVAGSPTRQLREGTSVDIRYLPISPGELERFTSRVDRRTSTAEMRATAPTPFYTQESRRVLVVEDNLVNQIIARGQLKALGYEVDMAGDGAQALSCCRRSPPDVVLMDVDMPVMGGIEATEQIRAWQQVGTIPPFPIVAATAGQAIRKDECLRAGMDGYLSKPIDLQVLADELHRVLPARATA